MIHKQKKILKLNGCPQVIVFFICAVMLSGLCPGILWAGPKPLTIACYQDYPPYSHVNEQGETQGLLIDFWLLWAQKSQMAVTFVPGSLTQCLEKVKTGQADFMIGLFKSEDRSAFMDFSKSFMSVHTNLYIQEDMDIDTIEQLPANVVVGVVKDDFAVSFFQTRYPNVHVQQFPSAKAVLEDVMTGKIKAFALNFPNAVVLMAKQNSLEEFKNLKTLYTEKLRAGVAKGNKELLKKIDKGLAAMPEKEIQALYNKWGIAPKPFILKHRGLLAGAIVVLLAGCIVFGIYVFKLKSKIQDMKEDTPSLDVNEWKQLISAGENDNVEFKSSLRWSTKEEKVNKRLEAVVVKTLSAFMNSRGGTLFIGINDDGAPVGIEPDYKTFQRKPNQDGFMLKLSDLISKNMGAQSHKLIVSDIQAVAGKDVCRIQVSPSDRPVFVTDQGKEAFYIRAGASSIPLGMSQAHEYISSHW
nr:transporter substrate-binding domain-containing protein [uncultured Desulfobacter sp.]